MPKNSRHTQTDLERRTPFESYDFHLRKGLASRLRTWRLKLGRTAGPDSPVLDSTALGTNDVARAEALEAFARPADMFEPQMNPVRDAAANALNVSGKARKRQPIDMSLYDSDGNYIGRQVDPTP